MVSKQPEKTCTYMCQKEELKRKSIDLMLFFFFFLQCEQNMRIRFETRKEEMFVCVEYISKQAMGEKCLRQTLRFFRRNQYHWLVDKKWGMRKNLNKNLILQNVVLITKSFYNSCDLLQGGWYLWFLVFVCCGIRMEWRWRITEFS